MRLRFDPASYPGWRPDGPVLVHAGEILPLTVDGDRHRPVTAPTAAPVLTEGRVRWSLAYGGNACPDRLVDKGLDVRGALLLPARIAGWQAVFEGRLTRYGSAPLTLVPAPGRLLEAWVLGAHEDDLPLLDRSEGRYGPQAPADVPDEHGAVTAPPDAYVLGKVGPVAVADRFGLADALAYLPGPATVLAATVDDDLLAWPGHDQTAAAAAVAARRTRAVPDFVIRPVPPGLWPPTPLDDLPLFVYGTLAPGASRWPQVQDLIADVEAAHVGGRLYDTGHGWPAARFGPDGVIHGYLLHPSGSAAACELYRRGDRIEGVPSLFSRTSVLVTVGEAAVWAASYAWAGDAAPGRLLADGRWPA